MIEIRVTFSYRVINLLLSIDLMFNWGYLLARFISAVGSWLDASNLRNRVYKLLEEKEIMKTALEDIQHMDPEGRIGWYAKETLERIEGNESKI